MSESPKNLEQKIDTIEEMISFAKQKFVTQDATIMILMGWMFFGIYLVWSLNDYFVSIKNPFFIQIGSMVLAIFAILFFFLMMKNKKRLEEIKKRNSYNLYIQNTKNINFGIVASFAVVVAGIWILQKDISLTPYFTVVFLTFLGLANFITSRLAHYKWVSWFSIPIWVLALLAAYFGHQNYFWVNWNFLGAIATLVGSVLPGHIIKYKTRHEKPSTP